MMVLSLMMMMMMRFFHIVRPLCHEIQCFQFILLEHHQFLLQLLSTLLRDPSLSFACLRQGYSCSHCFYYYEHHCLDIFQDLFNLICPLAIINKSLYFDSSFFFSTGDFKKDAL
ncbi:uncharacterized protein BX664DRAFT_338173, partial [Halteromyces radiatus]|uniref:uncharacterized protein n=1 Tax=Halteromyces radiatus TaxID=101107 RepID=UPI00222089C2